MNSFPDWLWVVVLALGCVLLIGARLYGARSRKRAFEMAAVPLGLTNAGTRNDLRTERKKFNLLSRGHSGRWTNLHSDLSGSCLMFDFSYTFGLPFVASKRYRQTVAAFSTRSVDLPDFQLTPATVLDCWAPALGFKAIKNDLRPEFGKRYWLRGPDEFRVGAVFTEVRIDELKALDPGGHYSIEKGGLWLIVYRHGTLAGDRYLVPFWHSAQRIAGLFLGTPKALL